MNDNLNRKSTPDEIRARFDADVERFSNLETGQAATIDAPLAMELITRAALAVTPAPGWVLDVGCGAGNNTIKLLQTRKSGGPVYCDLVDLSAPMLEAAERRLREAGGEPCTFQGDIREIELPEERYDVVLAAAVLHHLREDADWETVFRKLYNLTAPGGSLWVTDLVHHEIPEIQTLMWERYGEYLVSLKGEEYREHVFEYIDKEDSPRPVTFQIELLRKVGFAEVEILHKNSVFAAFGGRKGR